jgi:hypothetical protein
VDFTREPIIETVITPKEGCTLVVRSSKSSGQEEYFVDAIEVVIFGNAIFFRSRERPKAFLVPATDYEVLEVRETRLVLKNVGLDRSIKIAGGREAPLRHGRDIPGAKAERLAPPPEKAAPEEALQPTGQTAAGGSEDSANAEGRPEARIDKKRDRRRNYRRRRGKEDETGKTPEEEGELMVTEHPQGDAGTVELPAPHLIKDEMASSVASEPVAAVLSSLLAPPPNLISETIARYKDNALFKGAFFLKDEEEASAEAEAKEAEGETSSEMEDLEESHSKHLSETIFDTEGVVLPTMSLDYPVYGSVEPSVHLKASEPVPKVPEEHDVVHSDEPLLTEKISEAAVRESVFELVEEAYGVKKALEEERLEAEEKIAKGSVSAENPTIAEEINLKASEEALKEAEDDELDHPSDSSSS